MAIAMFLIIPKVVGSKDVIPKAHAANDIELRILYREGDKGPGMAFWVCDAGMQLMKFEVACASSDLWSQSRQEG